MQFTPNQSARPAATGATGLSPFRLAFALTTTIRAVPAAILVLTASMLFRSRCASISIQDNIDKDYMLVSSLAWLPLFLGVFPFTRLHCPDGADRGVSQRRLRDQWTNVGRRRLFSGGIGRNHRPARPQWVRKDNDATADQSPV